MKTLRMKKLGYIAVSALLALGVAVPAGTAFASGTLPNGLTAKVVAQSGETIGGNIDATGYDLGIYIGPGVHDVKVVGATVSGANDEGILVQDASNIVVKDSTIQGNALSMYTGGTEVKGLVLAGTRNVLVRGNKVEGNEHGGISLVDDGPNSTFAPVAIDSAPVASEGNVITGNLVKDNTGDCGIVISAKNPGGGVSGNLISSNTVVGFDPAAGDTVPGVGGIVVAGGAFGPVTVTDNVVLKNVVMGGFLPGISLHAFGPGVISGTQLTGNVLSNNGAGEVSGHTTGIEIFAVPNVGTITGTQVLKDSVSDDYYGVFHAGGASAPHVANLTTNSVTVPVFP